MTTAGDGGDDAAAAAAIARPLNRLVNNGPLRRDETAAIIAATPSKRSGPMAGTRARSQPLRLIRFLVNGRSRRNTSPHGRSGPRVLALCWRAIIVLDV